VLCPLDRSIKCSVPLIGSVLCDQVLCPLDRSIKCSVPLILDRSIKCSVPLIVQQINAFFWIMRDYIPELGGVRRRLCSPDHQVLSNYGMRALIGQLRSSAPLSRRAAEISVCYAFLFVACTTDFVKQLPPSIAASKDTAAFRAALLPYIARGDSVDAALRRLETIGFHCERLTESQANSGVAAAGRTLIHCGAQTFGQPTLYFELLISDSASHVRSFGVARNVVDFHMSDSTQAKP
jgi:hypothetical protein